MKINSVLKSARFTGVQFTGRLHEISSERAGMMKRVEKIGKLTHWETGLISMWAFCY